LRFVFILFKTAKITAKTAKITLFFQRWILGCGNLLPDSGHPGFR
jgi:hypothetical protein